MSNLVNMAEKILVDIIDVEKRSNEKKKKKAIGREILWSHTTLFIAAVIHERQSRVTQDQVANKYRISQLLIFKWYKEKDGIIAAFDKHKNCSQNKENQ